MSAADISYLLGGPDMMTAPLPPYSDEAASFLADLSRRLMGSPASRAMPDVAAVAFWCRAANIRRLADAYPERGVRLGRGLAFHVAPSNIPVNFAFTYFFGLLAGCANVVRVPSKDFPQVDAIIGAMRETIGAHPEVERRTAFVRYPRGSEATAHLSSLADARVIWGGDATVAEIRALATKPRCVDVCFADRWSFAIISGDAVMRADDETLRRLAERFYNDTYLMDQNACSSPRVVFWVDDSEAARERFWGAAADVAAAKYTLQPMTAMDKYTQMCVDAASMPEVSHVSRTRGNLLVRVELSSLPSDLTTLRGFGGYFYERALSDLDELSSVVDERWQTATYFGIDAQALRDEVIARRLRGIDRIVPIGDAMDIDVVWDGCDIITTLSRVVDVR